MITYLFQTLDQFAFDGCDNCEEYLHMKNNRDAVYECTSSNFDGLVLDYRSLITSITFLPLFSQVYLPFSGVLLIVW